MFEDVYQKLDEQLHPLPESNMETWNTWKKNPDGFHEKIACLSEDSSVPEPIKDFFALLVASRDHKIEDRVEDLMEDDDDEVENANEYDEIEDVDEDDEME